MFFISFSFWSPFALTSLIPSPTFVIAVDVAEDTDFIMDVKEESDFPAAMLANECFRCWSFGIGGSDEEDFDMSEVDKLLSRVPPRFEVEPSEFCK